MYIICNRFKNEVLCICSVIDYLDNGYPLDISRNIAYPKETTLVYEDIDVPDDIVEYKYCYTKTNGFYLNKDYKEPPHTVTAEEYEQLSANVDYLMLLTDADSATEEDE